MEKRRFIGQVLSALTEQRRRHDVARESHVVEHLDILPADEPHVVYECADTRWLDDVALTNDIYNQSVSREWEENDPKEDYKPEVISRIGPSS